MRLVSKRTNWILGILVVLLVVLPLALVNGKFEGSDSQGTEAIEASHPGFKPWAHPIWTPPSSEIEGLLWALEAAAGAGVIGYVLGRAHGAARGREGEDAADAVPAKQTTSTSRAPR